MACRNSHYVLAEDHHTESRIIEYYRGCRDALCVGTLFKSPFSPGVSPQQPDCMETPIPNCISTTTATVPQQAQENLLLEHPCIEYPTRLRIGQPTTMDFWGLFAITVGCALAIGAIANCLFLAFVQTYRRRQEAARQRLDEQRELESAREATEEQLRRQLSRQQRQQEQQQQQQPTEPPPQAHVGGRDQVRGAGPAAASQAQS
ncbi:uncharacterized protein PG986_009996 [Apiospora aurea]|uniref:Uncharacterized protein n=1 Tax=Apiospora aurea TaxID=335848 RepID=A0ABR1Q9B8_9PEZI